MKVRAYDWRPGPNIGRRTAPDEYIGLDVSLKETAVSIRRDGKRVWRDGKRVWRGKCASDPQLLAALIRKHAAAPERVVFETGPSRARILQ